MESALQRRSESTLASLAALDAAADSTAHVGVLLPWANVAVETELPRLGLRNTVFHYARLVPASRTTAVDESFWHGLREASAQALDSLSHITLDTRVLACTSAGFTGGPPLPAGVFTAFDALTAALVGKGLHRVVLATPYPASVTETEAVALAGAGVGVLAHASLGLDDGYPGIPAARVAELVEQFSKKALDAADAVVLSCTGWHTLAVVPELERRFGKPVFSSNLAMALLAAGSCAGVAP
jgi:maleate isomerase